MLKIELDDNWHVFNGIQLQQDWDIDHVLIGPGGVFAISTKSARGCFTRMPDGCIHLNGNPCDFAKQALGQTMELVSRLQALLGADVPYVQSVLAVPFGYVTHPEKSHRVWILHQENMTDVLEQEGKQKRLSKKETERLVTCLKSLAENSLKIWKKPPLISPRAESH
jgi:hypothetical protein